MAKAKKKKKFEVAPEYTGMAAAYFKDKQQAEAEGLKLSLGVTDYAGIVLTNCFYCNEKPTTPYTTQDKRSTLDRKDRLKHFTTDNSIAVCRNCYTARRKVSPKVAARIALITAVENARREWSK